MNRRDFLKTAATLIGSAALPPLPLPKPAALPLAVAVDPPTAAATVCRVTHATYALGLTITHSLAVDSEPWDAYVHDVQKLQAATGTLGCAFTYE